VIIAIDGPAGAGKSTVAKLLAQKLGFLYIDTGAMYRALALKAIESGIDIKDAASVVKMAAASDVDLVNDPGAGTLEVFLDGRDVSQEIRQPRVSRVVSDVAKIKGVREILVKLQRRLGSQKDSVLDGRDIGTIVFPGADKKFYIDAQFDERAMRRYKELTGLSQAVTLEEVKHDLRNRDTIDSTREHSPLKRADDAIYIDTTKMTIDEEVQALLQWIKR
jgi:CMP/dCMP kinase